MKGKTEMFQVSLHRVEWIWDIHRALMLDRKPSGIFLWQRISLSYILMQIMIQQMGTAHTRMM